MNNFTKSCGRAYWHSITNCSPSFGKLQSKSLKAVLLLMFFTLSSGALFAQDIDGCMHETLPTQADAEATIDTEGCITNNEIHLIPSQGTFVVHDDVFAEGVYDVSSGFNKTSTHCDWTYYYVFDLKCNNDIKRITVSYHGGDDTMPWLKDKKKYPFPSDQKGLDVCYDSDPTPDPQNPNYTVGGFPIAPTAQEIANLYTDNCEHVKASDMVKKESRIKNDDCGWIEIHTYTIKDYCDSNAFQMSLTFSGSDQSVPEFEDAQGNSTIPMDLVGDYAVKCDNIPPAQKLVWSDNCARGGKATAEPDDNNFDCSGGYILRTWNIEDDCGNKNSHTQKIDILPANPVKFAETPLNVYVPCADKADVADYFPAELGYSNGHLKIDYSDPPNNDYDYHCLVSGSVKAEYTPIEESCGSFQVTYSYDDECNSIVKVVTVHIVDDENPKILTASDRETVDCDGQGNLAELQAWLDSNGGADASDNCDNDLTWTNDFNDRDVPVLCRLRPGQGSIFVVFTVSDDCGNESKTGNWFTIVDRTAPVMTPAEDYRVICDGNGNKEQYERWIKENGGAKATEECSTVTWSNDGPVLGKDETLKEYLDGCSNYTGVIKVTFRATDDCGNYSESSADFSIEDSIAPVINTPAKDETVECDSSLPLFDLNYDMADTEALDENQYHYTSNLYKLIVWLKTNGGAGDVDEVCSSVSWSKELLDWELTGCYGYITVRFIATDECGNSSYTDATFRVEDTMSPVITEEAHDRDVECVDKDEETLDEDGEYRTPFRRWLWKKGYARAWDKCDKRLTWTNDWNGKSFSDECGETGAVTVMFTVTDECGLSSSTSAEFRIRDTKAPYLQQLPDLRFDLDENCMRDIHPETINSYPEYSDECGDVDVRWVDAEKQGEACKNYVLRTWTATDDCGNVTTKYQTIYLDDNSAPVLTGSVTQFNLTDIDACEAPAPPTNAQIAAQFDDNCYEPIVTLVNTNVSRDDICGWTTIFTYDVRDRCDNVYDGTVKVIYFGSDKTDPILDGKKPVGESGLNMCLTDALAAYPGVTDLVDLADQFKDECDTAKLRVEKSGPIDTTKYNESPKGCTWSFHYNYKIYDICGNYYEFNQYYSGEDKLAPRLNDGVDLNDLSQSDLNLCKADAPDGPSEQAIADLFTECGDDALDQEIFVERNKFDIGQDNDCNWQFLYEYTVTDKCGNAYPTFKVLISGSDQTKPTFSDDPLFHDNHLYTSQGADCPADATVMLRGNEIQVGDEVSHSHDNPDNVWTIAGTLQHAFNTSHIDDYCTHDDDLIMRVIEFTNTKDSCNNVITITFELEDACGNIADQVAICKYTIHDDTNPTASNPVAENVQCSDDVPAPDVTVVTDAADNCNTPTVTHVSDVSDNNFPVEVITRTYNVADGCGNSIDVTQTITVQDTTNPEVICPANIIVDATSPNGAVVIFDDPAISDNCGLATGSAEGAAYVRSTVGSPWGSTSNEQAMDAAFGGGNWDDLRFETVDVASLLADHNVIFIDGSQYGADELEAFLGANLPAIEAWVSDGGTLLLNAAPNEGDGMSFGFGGVQLTADTVSYTTAAASVNSPNPGHPIFVGPDATQDNLSGNYFGHAIICPPALGASLILKDASDPTKHVLVEADYGDGKVMFGGMTTTNWHSPQPAGHNLRSNILDYLSNAAATGPLQQTAGLTSGSEFPIGDTVNTFVVTDAAGNTGTCSFIVTVVDPTPPIAPEVNDDAKEEVTLNFKAYPVPFNKDVSLAYNFDFDTDVTIEVYDTKGLLVKKQENRGYKAGSDVVLPMSIQGADQLYYVKLITNRGTVTKKIVSSQVNKR